MKRILGIFICALTLAGPAAGASVEETQEAFEASQEARNIGVHAFHAGQLEKALGYMEEALKHRPNNPLLMGYVAYLAARTGDTGRALEVASAYARLGLSPGPEVRGSLKATLPPEESFGLMVSFETALKPRGKATTKFMMPTGIKLVEGIAFAPDGTLFVSAVASAGIWRMDGTGPVQILDGTEQGIGSLFGMAFHDGHLYATYAHIPQTPGYTEGEGSTGVVKLDPATGNIVQKWTLPPSESGQQLADMTITTAGEVFATDAMGKTVYQITGGTLFPLFRHPGFMNPQGITELNGHLVMADYGRGLWRLDRETGTAVLMAVPDSVSLHGIDGLASDEGKLIAIQNGVRPHRIVAVTLNEDASSVVGVDVIAKALKEWDEPTLGAVGPDGFYFVGSSQWPKYGKGGNLRDGEVAEPTALMKLGD